MGEVSDAIEVAAGSGDGAIMESGAHRSVSAGRLAASLAAVIKRIGRAA